MTASVAASRRSGLCRLAAWICTVSVLPCRPAGQARSPVGVPRYTACTSSRAQADRFLARFTTGQDAGTCRLTPSKVTLRQVPAGAASPVPGSPTTMQLTTVACTNAYLRNPLQLACHAPLAKEISPANEL